MGKQNRENRHGIRDWRWIVSCKEIIRDRAMWVFPGAASLAIVGGVLYNAPVYDRIIPINGNLAENGIAEVHSQSDNDPALEENNSIPKLVVNNSGAQDTIKQSNARYTGPEHDSMAAYLQPEISCKEQGDYVKTAKEKMILNEKQRHQQALNNLASMSWTGKFTSQSQYETAVKNEVKKHQSSLDDFKLIDEMTNCSNE
jgi:hypothetical protein